MRLLRRLGKLAEELGELSAVAGRCIIQGHHEVDPGSGVQNIVRLQSEIADVYAQLDETVLCFNLDEEQIRARRNRKRAAMQEWERISE